jgi:hypothetical protein
MFRRSDFRNTRSVRMASKWIDGKRMMESATVKKFEQPSHAELKNHTFMRQSKMRRC